MFDFLSCGFTSVLGGLLTSLLIAGCLLAYSTQFTRRGAIAPLSLVICFALFCALFFQTTLLYSAIGSKSVAMDFISACHLQFGNEINGAELKEQMMTLIRENPLISFFIDYADLEDFDWSQPIKSLRKVVAREYNWYMFRRIVWAVTFTAIALAGVLLTTNQNKSRRSSYHNDDFSFD